MPFFNYSGPILTITLQNGCNGEKELGKGKDFSLKFHRCNALFKKPFIFRNKIPGKHDYQNILQVLVLVFPKKYYFRCLSFSNEKYQTAVEM